MKALRSLALFAAATALMVGSASADGMRRSMKDAPAAEKPRCTFSANTALTTEYVFRGFSQSAEGAAVQGGFDATCGIFYAGVWASSLNWNDGAAAAPAISGNNASVEMDWYLGIKPVTGPVTWDLGVIYYTYPNARRFTTGGNNEYVELKLGASGEIWKKGTLGGTAYYSPEYQYNTGSVWTFEGSFAQELPKVSIFTPTFSALLGYQTSNDRPRYSALFGNGDTNYMYWNVGLTFAFAEKWSLDVRYWDTNLADKAAGAAFCQGNIFQCDERVVGTLKFTF